MYQRKNKPNKLYHVIKWPWTHEPLSPLCVGGSDPCWEPLSVWLLFNTDAGVMNVKTSTLWPAACFCAGQTHKWFTPAIVVVAFSSLDVEHKEENGGDRPRAEVRLLLYCGSLVCKSLAPVQVHEPQRGARSWVSLSYFLQPSSQSL